MKYLTIFIVILGVGFLALGVLEYLDQMKYEKPFYKVHESIDVVKFYKSNDFEKRDTNSVHVDKKYHIIYFFTSDDCSPCTKEINDYYDLIKDKYSDMSIQQVGVISDTSMMRVRMFIRKNEFKMPIYYGYDSNYLTKLNTYNSKIVNRQLIIIDSEKKEIVLRAYLRKGYISDIKEKMNMLNTILK